MNDKKELLLIVLILEKKYLDKVFQWCFRSFFVVYCGLKSSFLNGISKINYFLPLVTPHNYRATLGYTYKPRCMATAGTEGPLHVKVKAVHKP